MEIKYKGSLQRTMVVYFLLISFASFLIAGEFIFDIHSKELRSELTQNFERLSMGKTLADDAFRPIQALGDKAVLMVVLFLVVVLVVLTMFVKNITEPLQHMIEKSKLIAAGDLSQTVNIRAKNELADMGSTINDLTSNLQEMILLSKSMCGYVEEFTEEISHELGSQNPNLENTDHIQKKIHILNSNVKFINDIIHNCKFYGIGG